MSSSIKSPVSFPFYCVHQASNSKFLNRAERLTESNKPIRQRLAELCGLFFFSEVALVLVFSPVKYKQSCLQPRGLTECWSSDGRQWTLVLSTSAKLASLEPSSCSYVLHHQASNLVTSQGICEETLTSSDWTQSPQILKP